MYAYKSYVTDVDPQEYTKFKILENKLAVVLSLCMLLYICCLMCIFVCIFLPCVYVLLNV